jgi:hypothetical protein
MNRTSRAALAGFFVCPLLLAALAPALHAQADYTATRSTRIQAGVGILILKNDYVPALNKGITLFGDYDFSRFAGLEADVHLGGLVAPESIGENTYLAGPRLTYRRRNATVYGKVLIGRGSITNQAANLTTSFNAFAYGGGVEYRLNHKLNLRLFDAELQKWPNFESHTLSPIAATVGVAYILR